MATRPIPPAFSASSRLRRAAEAAGPVCRGSRPTSAGADERVDPRWVACLPRVDRGKLLEEIAHLVCPGQKHHPGERIDLERQILVAREVHDLGFEVDG